MLWRLTLRGSSFGLMLMAMPPRALHGRKPKAPTLAVLRSAVTNGTQLFVEHLDARSAWSRRLRDLIADHVADLGGIEVTSSAEKALVRRAAMLTLQAELMEANFAKNEDGAASIKQIDAYQRVCGTLRRTLESLGLRRRARDVTPRTPSLREYLHGQATGDAADEEERAT